MRGLIMIEGLDLAGKSTLIQGLAERLPGPVRVGHNMLCADNPIAALAERLRHDPQRTAREGSYLFLAAHEWDLRHYQAPSHGTHLQDSGWLRGLAYERTLGSPEMVSHWRACRARWPQIDGLLLLSASLEQRRRRLAQRAVNDANDRWVITRPERFLALERALREEVLALGGQELDTTDLTPTQVLEQALGLLRPLRRVA